LARAVTFFVVYVPPFPVLPVVRGAVPHENILSENAGRYKGHSGSFLFPLAFLPVQSYSKQHKIRHHEFSVWCILRAHQRASGYGNDLISHFCAGIKRKKS